MEQLLGLLANFGGPHLERDDFLAVTSGQSISLHEFLYPVMQAYDSVVIKADVNSAAPTSCSTCSPAAAHGKWAWNPRSASRCCCSGAPMA